MGTTITFDCYGDGRPVILIGGAFHDRSTLAHVAEAIADDLLAITYDRRGRGASTNEDTHCSLHTRECAQLGSATWRWLSSGHRCAGEHGDAVVSESRSAGHVGGVSEEPRWAAWGHAEPVMLVEVPCPFVDRVDDDQPTAGELDRVGRSSERVEQGAGAQPLAVETLIERESGEQDRGDAVRRAMGRLGGQRAANLVRAEVKEPTRIF